MLRVVPHYDKKACLLLDLGGEQNESFDGAAVHLHPQRACELVRGKAKRGVEELDERDIFWLDPPYELVSYALKKRGSLVK